MARPRACCYQDLRAGDICLGFCSCIEDSDAREFVPRVSVYGYGFCGVVELDAAIEADLEEEERES